MADKKSSWLPIIGGIIIVSSILVAYSLLFRNSNPRMPVNKPMTEQVEDNTEGVSYVINRDTLVENGQCRVKILQAIVKKNTVLLYFSLENHFKSDILDIVPYLIDVDNGGQIVRNNNMQQFSGIHIVPTQIGTMVGKFDYAVGKSQHFKFGFRFLAKGMTADGDVSVPFELK
jgi:hypothetical protein